MDKHILFEAWGATLRAAREELRAAQEAAREGTRVDGSHRPANRGERAAVSSQGYLAHGLAERLVAVDAALDLLDRMPPSGRGRVVTGCQVELEEAAGEDRLRLAVLPGGDGSTVGGWQVVSPEAPVVRACWGREAGDEVELQRGGVRSTWVIEDVR